MKLVPDEWIRTAVMTWRFFSSWKRQKCLLIVEDNLHDAFHLRRIIESVGYRCEVVDRATSAIELMNRKHYPIVFLDFRLPGLAGWTFLNKIAGEYPKVHFVAVCGEPQDIAKVEDGIYFGVIAKPPSKASIEAVIRHLNG